MPAPGLRACSTAAAADRAPSRRQRAPGATPRPPPCTRAPTRRCARRRRAHWPRCLWRCWTQATRSRCGLPDRPEAGPSCLHAAHSTHIQSSQHMHVRRYRETYCRSARNMALGLAHSSRMQTVSPYNPCSLQCCGHCVEDVMSRGRDVITYRVLARQGRALRALSPRCLQRLGPWPTGPTLHTHATQTHTHTHKGNARL